MSETEILKQYYETYDEDGRLLSKHGQVEFITTQKYMHTRVYAVGASHHTLDILRK